MKNRPTKPIEVLIKENMKLLSEIKELKSEMKSLKRLMAELRLQDLMR